MEIHRKFFESYFWEKTFVTLVIPRAIAIYQFGRRACNPNLRIWSQVWTYGDHSGNNVLIGTTYIDLYKTKPRTKTRVCGVGGSFFIVQVIRIVARNSGFEHFYPCTLAPLDNGRREERQWGERMEEKWPLDGAIFATLDSRAPASIADSQDCVEMGWLGRQKSHTTKFQSHQVLGEVCQESKEARRG